MVREGDSGEGGGRIDRLEIRVGFGENEKERKKI